MPPRKHDQYPYPIDDRGTAKRWLWQLGQVQDWIDRDADDLLLHVRLVCDVFWVKPETLLRGLRRDCQAALSSPRSARGDRRQWGWR